MKIGILALANCMYSSVAGPFDILTMASLTWKGVDNDKKKQPFSQIEILSPDGKSVRTFNGLEVIPHRGIDDCETLDLVIIPVIYGNLESVLSLTNVIRWLTKQHLTKAYLCAVCSGVFLLAETGLLKDKKATTHWMLADYFRSRYPEIILKREKVLVDEGDIITAGAVTAYQDLSIYLVRRFGSPELALLLSKTMLVDSIRQTQEPYRAIHFYKSHGDAAVLQAQDWLESHFKDNVSISAVATELGIGERTLARRFKKATGETLLEYLQLMRVEAAKRMLESSKENVESITFSTGYEDASSFRRLFKKHTGLSPTAYRKKFSLQY